MTAALVLTGPSLVVMSVHATPARAWDIEDCSPGVDCPGDPGGGSFGFDNGDCLWDSCGDGSQGGDPDPSDQCTDSSCQDGQNPPEQQCTIIVEPDGTIVCVDNQPGDPPPPPPPPPPDCTATGDCPDPITEGPVDPSTCAPADDGTQFLFNQDNFTQDTLTTDPFPTMDPLYNDMCPPPPIPPPPSHQFGATDVAFGDSYISGEGQGPFVASPIRSDCDVANDAWPNLAYGTGGPVGAIFGAGSSKPFENWACTGAKIADITAQINTAIKDGKTDDNVTHAQWAGLGTDTARVQISAGGNDLGFSDDLRCAYSVLRHDDRTHKIRSGNVTCIPDPTSQDTQSQVSALIPRLTALYELAASIPGDANGASGPTVEAISYPEFFPAGNTPACGWSQTGITRADQIWINQDALLINNAIRQAAAAAGVDFVDFGTALQGATICDTPPGVNTVTAIGGFFGHLQGAFHPNALGHQRLLASYLRQNFFSTAGVSASTPADGTLVGDRAGDGIYVAAGGALFPFTKQADLSSSAYAGTNIVLEPSNQVAAQLSAKPADGTLLKDATTGAVFAVSGGTLIPLAPTQFVLPAITVPSQSLDGYPIASGDFFKVAGGDGTVYESVGGAPVPVTDWSHVGGSQPTGTLSQGQFNNMLPVPPDGTFVSATVPGTSTKNNYEFAGGAPIFVSDFSHVGGQPASTPIAIDQTAIDDAGSGGAFNHINPTPADGTVVTATPPGTTTANGYVFAGGAPIYISDWSHVGGQPSGPIAAIDQTAIDNAGTGGVYNHIRPIPADGTYVSGQGAGGAFVESYVLAGGAPIPVTDWTHLGGPASGTPPDGVNPVPVDETAIDNAGTGGVYNHLRPIPADGTFVSATGPGTSTTNNYEIAGGAPIFVSDFSHVGGVPATSTAIDQTAIDNAGTGGVFSHLRPTPADGTFVTATPPGTSTVNSYVFAGGAPVYISDWSHVGGQPSRPIPAIDQTAIDNAGTGGVYNHVLPTPADGTYVSGHGAGNAAVQSYSFAGGAPIAITDWTHLGGPNATTPPAGINPVTVDETALDNAGSGGPYNHVRAQPADGTILAGNADKTNGIFVIAGGAPIYVSNWEDIGGARGSANVDQTAINPAGSGGVFNHLNATPADRTLIESFGTGHIFVIAGGAPLEVSSLANIGSPTQTPVFVDQVALDKAGSGGFYNHLNFKPADNTLIAGNATNYFVVAGGAPIYVPYLEDIGGARGFVTVDEAAIDQAGTGGDWNHLSAMPANGTIVESFNTGKVYQIISGVPTLDCSAGQTFLYIDQFALDKAGTGGFYNHLKPLPSPPPAPCPTPTPTDPGPQL